MSEAIFRSFVEQDAYRGDASEGSTRSVRVNPRGELVGVDTYMQWVLDGRVYNISHAAQEAGDLCGETGPGTDNVNPSLLIDVPSGTTIIPLEVMVGVEGTGTAGDWLVRINADDGTHYSSGGASLTPINLRLDDPNTSSVSAYSGSTQIVASANTDDNTLYFRRLDQAALGDSGNYSTIEWSARTHIPPVLIGPASFLVFVIVGNVDNEVLFSVKWAEFSTTNVT